MEISEIMKIILTSMVFVIASLIGWAFRLEGKIAKLDKYKLDNKDLDEKLKPLKERLDEIKNLIYDKIITISVKENN
jgi:Tfp pilus assembly protein PilO